MRAAYGHCYLNSLYFVYRKKRAWLSYSIYKLVICSKDIVISTFSRVYGPCTEFHTFSLLFSLETCRNVLEKSWKPDGWFSEASQTPYKT